MYEDFSEDIRLLLLTHKYCHAPWHDTISSIYIFRCGFALFHLDYLFHGVRSNCVLSTQHKATMTLDFRNMETEMPWAKNTSRRFQKTIFISIVIVTRLIPRVQTDLSFHHLLFIYFFTFFFLSFLILIKFYFRGIYFNIVILFSFNFFHPLVQTNIQIRDRVLKMFNMLLAFIFGCSLDVGKSTKVKMNVIYLNVMALNGEPGMWYLRWDDQQHYS